MSLPSARPNLIPSQNNRNGNPIYTAGVIPSLKDLDWHSFLERPRLPSPTLGALDALRQETILITGAGGSIGSALALRLGTFSTGKLVLLEASESNLYALKRDWADAFAGGPNPHARSMSPILGSADDRALLDEIFFMYAPRIVFHAAAFKHVPLMEEQPLAAIANNVFATEILTEAAAARGSRVVLLSTDKAVEPASVMGATKRIAEQIVLARGGTVLRLGNVLASRDSVAEVFAGQIAQGGPITITDPAARRYFLTLDEAVDLLLTAAALPLGAPSISRSLRNGWESTLLVPVLPKTHFIADLARFMARELCPEGEVAIDFTAHRPGDKEAEQLWSAGDRTSASSLEGLVLIESALPAQAELASRLAGLRAALDARNLRDALTHLRALVPDYTPSRTLLALAQQSMPGVCL
ncbi:MAG: polysaccharide biosynthesis protein [Terracidiphilus sp.]